MRQQIITKKIKLYPVGDKEEVTRVYQYIRDGQYNQYLALNRLMSEIGTIYYHYNRDIKNEDYKNDMKKLFTRENIILDDITFPKGADVRSSVGMRVRQDFSTALKNGLAKGERSLPFYKRNFPLLATGRSLSVYKEDDNYIIKWVNKIQFKVVLGSSGKNNAYIMTLLEALAENNDNYKICGSQLQIDNHKIFIFLTVQKTIQETEYSPEPGRVMGVALGYDKPLIAALNDNDKVYEIEGMENFVEKRIYMQSRQKKLSENLKNNQGGRGRSHKLKAMEHFKNREKNFAKSCNHILSKKVVKQAEDLKAEVIVLEHIEKHQLDDAPVMLRNWSYYQLYDMITYKAKMSGMKVIIGEPVKKEICCCKCGGTFEKEVIFSEDRQNGEEWSEKVTFKCIHCHEEIDYDYNKARNLAVMG